MRSLTGNRLANIVIVVALSLIPLLYASMLTWAYEAPINRIDRIPAAIVNLDSPAEATLQGTRKTLRVGDDLTERLTGSGKQGFGWHEVGSEKEARAGLDKGTYQAFLLIPADLSRNMADLADIDKEPRQTTLHLYTNDGVNYLTGTLAQSVAEKLQETASSQGAKDYISSLLLSMGPIKDGLTEASQGAGKLADGTSRLAEGSEELRSGTEKAAAGARTLADGATRLADGTTRSAHGAAHLATGSDQAVAGSRTLTLGIAALAGGANSLADGSQRLRGGLAAYTQGAGALAEGTATLHDGLTHGHDGQPSFQDGLHTLTHQLADVTDPDTISGGAARLAEGAERADQGVVTLGEGATRLLAGVDRAHEGATRLGAGIEAAHEGATRLVAGVDQAHDGATALSDGSTRVAEGARQLSAALAATDPNSLKGGIAALHELADGLHKACAALFLDPVCVGLRVSLHNSGLTLAELPGRIDELSAGVDKAANAAGQIAQGADRLDSGAHQLAGALAPGTNPANPTLRDGAQRLAAALATGTDPANPTLRDGIDQLTATLAAGTDPADPTLRDGIAALHAATLPSAEGALHPVTLRDATQALAAGSTRLAEGTQRAGAGALVLSNALDTRIVPGVSALRDGSARLSEAGPNLLAGAERAAQGATRLAAGAQDAHRGAGDLTAGLDALNQGAHRLADGQAALTEGAGRLSGGAGDLAGGVTRLDDGAHRLADGAGQAATGATELARRLADGAAQVPHLSDAAAETDADIASQPIAVEPTRLNAVSSNGIGFSSFFMALSLYIGAIGIFFVIPALDVRRSLREPFWVAAVRTAGTAAGLGTIQAIAVVLGLELMLNLQAADLLGLTALCVLTSWTFVAINQALVASLGFRGRFVSLLLMCLQLGAAAGTFAIETAPRFLQRANEVLPMGYTVRGIRALTAGSTLPVMPGLAVYLTWLIGAIWLTLWAASRRVGLRPMPYDPALAYPGNPPKDPASLIASIGENPRSRAKA